MVTARVETFGFARRRLIVAGACAFCYFAAARPSAAACPDLTGPPTVDLNASEIEGHRIFLLLAMALVHDFWCVDQTRPDLARAYAEFEPGRRFSPYDGHNIGALLVSDSGAIGCFALNRNVVLNSTLEHAEARAVRQAIAAANAARGARGETKTTYGDLLRGYRLYTTLEPCAQCAGIIDLATVKSVVFPQDDPAQHHIANVLFNLRDGSPAPLPIRATFLEQWAALEAAYRAFVAAAPPNARTGLTSFLETVAAYKIYRAAAQAFDTLSVDDAGTATLLSGARAFRAMMRTKVEAPEPCAP